MKVTKKLRGLVAVFATAVLTSCAAVQPERQETEMSTPRGRYLVYIGGTNNAGSLWMFDYPSHQICQRMFNLKAFNAATNHERMNPKFTLDQCRPFKTITSREQKVAAVRGAIEVAENAGESQIYVEIPEDWEDKDTNFDRSKRQPRI